MMSSSALACSVLMFFAPRKYVEIITSGSLHPKPPNEGRERVHVRLEALGHARERRGRDLQLARECPPAQRGILAFAIKRGIQGIDVNGGFWHLLFDFTASV
jgi:hypothetical protein